MPSCANALYEALKSESSAKRNSCRFFCPKWTFCFKSWCEVVKCPAAPHVRQNDELSMYAEVETWDSFQFLRTYVFPSYFISLVAVLGAAARSFGLSMPKTSTSL